ncbi:hypothetical protein JKF63_03178 [Porcisia hertigi]|uniref:RING-CH-type domain-containing protein n=1 Tax=Porcisia hertigi TaxID=2761500 RepID=A0A836L733_9TRYP|nr:hypothetical protein JKF63_03178 [Porcisia hertigi]
MTTLHQGFATMMAVLALCSLALTSTYASPPSKSVLTLALFDINNSRILSTTSTSESVSFGHRSLFVSQYEPSAAVSVAPLQFHGHEKSYVVDTQELLIVPYCVVESGSTDACNFEDCIVYLMFRFRHHYEANFDAVVWQDPTPLASTAKALQDFKRQLNRSDVAYPDKDGSMRMEDSATCADITDECYSSRVLTYTSSYKEIDPTQYSARFLFRLNERYTLNSPLRVRLHSSLPHDAETLVDGVLVLSPPPTFNPLNHRWWIESVAGRLVLLVVSAATTFSFLTVTREVGALMAGQRRGEGALPHTLLYNGDISAGPLIFLQRAAKVAGGALQKSVAYVWANVQALACLAACCTLYPRWLNTRYRRAPADERVTVSERESTDLNTANLSGGDEEEDGPRPICRICRSSRQLDDLFAPCACNGSSQFVHRHCLERWREMTSNPDHRRVCAECKTPYTLVRVIVPQNPDLITSSPFIESAIRHYVARFVYLVMAVGFAGGGAYVLKALFFVVTLFDDGVDWSLNNGYHWFLTAYFLLALALNLSLMEPFVKDMRSAEAQLLFVLLSLLFIEVPLSYGTSALLSLIFNHHLTWEVSYGVGLFSAFILHFMETFSSFSTVLDSFSAEREVVAARAEQEVQPSV